MGPPLSGQGTALKPPKEALLETLAAYSPRSWPSCRSRRREAPFPAPPPGRPDTVLPGDRGSENPQALPEVTWGLGPLRG